ncbi:MAG TPA: hypothetical protein VH280_21035 [Verrucomicrobiae bacterium]|jgi:hypothetical protein|nr:hypothetical protein [Verrucomicrobiae bacterium]
MKFIFPLCLVLLIPCCVLGAKNHKHDQNESVTVNIATGVGGQNLASDFLGLSYESSELLSKDGKYYFDTDDRALINTFRTLGIKNLRVGANAVDDPTMPVPGVRDIDVLFDFARAAGVKVIYSFRLRNGDLGSTARLANYIAAHDSDALDCFAIGNEPNFYSKSFPEFLAQWKVRYAIIRNAVPNAMFDGPSSADAGDYVLSFASALDPEGHLAMASDHYYFLGSGRAGEKNPAATRARFLQDSLHAKYAKDYARVGAVLAAHGIPYRIDEMNSCYNGGARDASDTYASTLWALDCTHWWAAHHILGVNFHTGESVGRDGGFGPANYAAFVHTEDGTGINMRPQAYALLAFTQAAHGQPLDVNVQKSAPAMNFDAYAYRDTNNSVFVTLINKSYGSDAKTAAVSIQLPSRENVKWHCHRMDLVQQNQDIAAKGGLMLGGAEIGPDGLWQGKWKNAGRAKKNSVMSVLVPSASAAILHFEL